jgi:Fe-S cluster assembly iron-binding protein IscA
MTEKPITLPNLCPHVRVQVENKAYRVFSIRYTHPKDSAEDAWTIFRVEQDKPILIDKETLQMLSGKEITWLYKDGTDMVNTEPTIAACEIREVGPTIEEVE